MARKRTGRGQSRLDQLSRIFKAKAIADSALTQKQSNFRGKRSFPTDVSPLRVLASLNATESAISRSMGQRRDENTEAPRDMTMRGESTEFAQPPRFGLDVTCFARRNHNLDGGVQSMLNGEIEGGMDRKYLGSKKQQTNSVKRKDPSKPEGLGEPVDAGNTAELAESEEQRDDAEEPRYEVDEIISHRIKNTTEVELGTRWNGCSKPTFVDERTIQQDYPFVLYDYWELRGGREEATGISLFHVFQIRRWKIKNKKLQFLVQWVGYPPKDSTWELAWRVEKFATEMHRAYLKTHSAARSAWEKEESKTQT
ncbi:hypothetical protein FOBRF1_010892 [Fusarium oxysporum]